MKDIVLSAEETAAINVWSAESQALAREILGKYPEKRSAVMPLLYVSMIENGYVTNEGMKSVSILTGLTAAQV